MSDFRPEIVQDAPGDPGTRAEGCEAASEALRPSESPAERLRRAAALIERRADAAPRGIWDLIHVRAALDPWVALMGPDLAAPLATLLRDAATNIDRYLSPLGAGVWRHELALADLILSGDQ